MFSKVLLATDFMSASQRAFQYLKDLAESGMVDEVILLHVIDERDIKDAQKICVGVKTGRYSLTDVDLTTLEECEEKARKELISHAKKELEKLKDQMPDIKVRCLVKVGEPFMEIISLAEKEKVSLIVVGSHGKGVARTKSMGSCSESVVRYATRPVLVVK